MSVEPLPVRPPNRGGIRPPSNSQTHSFHWLDINGRKDIMMWIADAGAEVGNWIQGSRCYSPSRLANLGFIYWAPVEPPPREPVVP